jgi:DGQHR domain-containing protein
MTNNAEIIESASLEEAVMKTMMDAANCNGSVIPVIVAKQGKRTTLSGAMSVGLLDKHVQTDSAKKSASPDELALAGNRPLLPEHVDAIAKYLTTNAGAPENGKGTYILPPVTLCVKDPLRVYSPKFSSTPTCMGYMVLPGATKVGTTDGQHREAGIGKARNNMGTADKEAFETDSITFMLTLEDNIEQAHQDFADCSKTKAIPPSMLAVYDRRVPANKLVLELTKRCPVFVEKIDSTSKKLGKNSTCLFTANQVRQLVKSLLTGDMAMSETAFLERVSRTEIPDDDPATLEDVVNRCVNYIDFLSERIDAWKVVAAITKRGPQMAKIKDLRQYSPSLLYTATGLNIVGCVGYEIFKNHKDEWRMYAERLANLKFDKSDKLWSDVLEPKVNKAGEKVFNISTNRAPVERAIARVLQAIGLDPEPTPEQPRPIALSNSANS